MGQNQSKLQSAKKKNSNFRGPLEWKNDADFEVVSPLSDISNPSQFRGHHCELRDQGKKVCLKQKSSTSIPAPGRFYFQSADSDATNEDMAPPQITTKPTWLRAQCSKVKTHLSVCFIQKNEKKYHGDEHIRCQSDKKTKRAGRKT